MEGASRNRRVSTLTHTGRVRIGRGVHSWETHLFEMDNQQGPTVQHQELCSVPGVSLDGRGARRRVGTCAHS